MTVKDGGPAFPVVHTVVHQPGDWTYTPEAKPGMSLRDYFAAAALTGLIVNPATISVYVPITRRAYELADAMLKAREAQA